MSETTNAKIMRYGAKAGIMAGSYVAIDKFVLRKSSTTKSTAICFGSIIIGSLVAQYVADTFIKDNTLFGLMKNGKSVESQAAQLAASVGTSTIIEKVIFKNSYNSSDLLNIQSIALLAGCNVAAELMTDVLYQRPIDAFD